MDRPHAGIAVCIEDCCCSVHHEPDQRFGRGLTQNRHTSQEARLFTSKAFFFALLPALFLIGGNANSQNAAHDGVVPLNRIPSEQWIEKVWGDSDKPGLPFVIRIHNDAGYVVLPHTHPQDENIAIVRGSWALGMGRRFNASELKPMELGAFGFTPKRMAHFGYAKTETIIQVHGIGPFEDSVVDPVYQLTDKGVLLKPSLVKPGVPTPSSPPDCFELKIGAHVRGAAGEGIVVGALCSPANRFTQYWIRKPNGERFWTTIQDLKTL